jgi:hypothetical protein
MTENIGFVFEVIYGNYVLIYGVKYIWNILGIWFFIDGCFLKITNCIVVYVAKKSVGDELEFFVVGLKL